MDAENDLLKGLTAAQTEAVTHPGGPLLIVAGAGSGKTRVITRRVAWLISQGVTPSSILAITFTNKAAGEMKERVSAVLGRPPRGDFGRLEQPSPMICTFHSLCLRILKHYAATAGLASNFSVFDSADQSKLIKQAMKELDISSTNFPPSSVHSSISRAKNKLLTPQQVSETAGDIFERIVARVYVKYQAYLKANSALDFDDLLLETCHAFRKHPEVLAELQERFKHILIDEYQDTNHAQYILAHAMAAKGRNITVVGDPDQSIYAWRGADLSNILEFEEDYPDAKVVRLEQNYRSTKTVLAIASQLIGHNRIRKEKSLWTENQQGAAAELYCCGDEHDEAEQVARRLRSLNGQGHAWSEMAIFYRMNSLSRVMEDALRRAGIPYQIARGVEFYNRKEIKDVLAYLRAAANPNDEVSLERIANVPTRGISDATMKSLQLHAVTSAVNLWEAMKTAERIAGITPRALAAVSLFVKLMEQLQGAAETLPAQKVMEYAYQRSGLEAMLKNLDPTSENEIPNVNELISSAAEFDREHPDGRISEYLTQVSLVSDADRLEGTGGAVTLMTLHAAKGLEFPVVAIIGLEEGCLPHARAREQPAEMEEERRLCFVGITRAQQRLILSNAAWRTMRGRREPTIPSPFIDEMPRDLLDVTDRSSAGRSWRDDDRQSWSPGSRRPWASGGGRRGAY